MATVSSEAADPRARRARPTRSDATGVYHFLDVGGLKYGECTLVEFGPVRILIDGSHPEDFRGQQGYDSLPEQLDAILDGERPHRIDLIVVTHCHNDHVGCLPALVENDVVKADFALLTDPKMGFGRSSDEDAPTSDSITAGQSLAALLREEDASDLDDDELAAFIADAITVEQRYAQFIEDLEAADTEIVYYHGEALSGALAERLAPTGVKLLGPSLEQLLLCAEQIATTNKEADQLVADHPVDSTEGLIDLYRSVLIEDDRGRIRNPRGNGMNCQSIVFSFGPPGEQVLLAGDMQFAEPGVRGADEEVEKLRRRVAEAGPFKVFKTTHHTSHNGFDEALLEQLGNPPILIHSGGLRDETHPYPGLLEMLEDEGEGIVFARTDRNGLITVRPEREVSDAVEISRGELNDFSPNREPDTTTEQPETKNEPLREQQAGAHRALSAPQIIIVNLPPGPVDMAVAGVDIRVRSSDQRRSATADPGRTTRRTPEPGRRARRAETSSRFDSILFVTDPDRLRVNIGRAEADGSLRQVAAMGELLSGTGQSLARQLSTRLRRRDLRGVILLGGYDVVPPRRFDVLDRALRQRLGTSAGADGDNFIIWSDAAYGDVDGDGIAELPLSRIPDGRDAELFSAALAARAFRPAQRFGVRNVARPFAEPVFRAIAGQASLAVSEPFVRGDVRTADLAAECHYFMLHGADDDGRRFTGEYQDGRPGYPIAFEVDQVPRQFNGIVFTGCCWGALIADAKASDGSGSPAPRVAEASIALSYLKAGANAFVGCTGSHYSGPSTNPDQNYAARLHTAFWSGLVQDGLSPAAALHEAKVNYMQDLLSRGQRLNPLDTARRLKNFSQFTCLGLGW
jgi:beta-lactamase superfamily II metal-dependent hydrolase